MTYKISDIKKSQHCQKTSNSTICFKENGNKFSINNKSKKTVYKCRVDDGLIKDKTIKKCDFLSIIDEKKEERVIFIELKGKHYEVAFQQILSTDKIIDTNINGKTIKKEAFIVTSQSPAISTYQKKFLQVQKEFKKQNIDIKKPTSKYKEIES